MKFFNVTAMIAAAALLFSTFALAEESNPPPIAQPLVREGQFARQLVEVLKMTPAQNEAEAENMLTAAGIVPQKGWIADYPVTPDILSELEESVQNAARSGAIGLNEEEALRAFEGLKKDVGLAGVKGSGETYAESEPPTSYSGDYPPPAAVDDYYETQGPPVVTYYPPPYPYYGLYGWVPYPFWFSGVFFSGFFILHDFHRPFFVHKKVHLISNHFFDHQGKRVITVTPHKKFLRDTAGFRGPGTGGISREGGFQQKENILGNRGPRSDGIRGPGRGDGGKGPSFKFRGSGNDRGQPRFNSGPSRGSEGISTSGRTTANPGRVMQSGGEFNRRGGGGEMRGPRSFGSENRVISPQGRGSGGSFGSIRQERGSSTSFSGSQRGFFNGSGSGSRGGGGSFGSSIGQERGGSTSFSGRQGGFFNNSGSSRGGFSGSGNSLKGFSGGGGRGRR